MTTKHKTSLKERRIKQLLAVNVLHHYGSEAKKLKIHERRMHRDENYRKAYERHIEQQAERAKASEAEEATSSIANGVAQ